MEAIGPRKRYDFDRVTRIVITIVCIAAIIFVVDYMSSVLLPFVVGCLLAYMLDPFVEFNRRILHLKGRVIATTITLVITFGLITLTFYLLIPYLIDEFSQMTDMLTAYAKSEFKVPYIPAAIHRFLVNNIDINHLSSIMSKEQWMKVINSVASHTWSFVGGTMSVILTIASWLIVLLYLVFVLVDYDNITEGFRNAIPPRYRKVTLKIWGDVENTMRRYFRGQALVSLFVGIIFAIEFYIIGLPMAIVFGLSVGVLNMVPYLQLISIPVAALLCLVGSVASGGSFWALFGWTIGAYCLCQLIQDLVLTPLIMKQQMGLKPAIIFLSLAVWSYLLGFIGLIIALPLTTLIISYYKQYVLHQKVPDDDDGDDKNDDAKHDTPPEIPQTEPQTQQPQE
jgi:predicted PurR-regulated permease PerM